MAVYRGGIGIRGCARAGAAVVACGEFSIVIAGLAVNAGLEPQLGPLAAAYVQFLAILGPIAARTADSLTSLWQSRHSAPSDALR